MTTRSRLGTAIATALLAIALPLSLAACTTSNSAPTAGGAAESSSGIGAEWGACMREAGFDVTDPSDDLIASGTVAVPSGADQDRYRNAAATCSERVGVRRADSAQQQKWARQYDRVASCIREHGYPDLPEQERGSIGADPEEYPRAAEPKFEKTFQSCLAKYAPDTKTQHVG